MKKAINLLCLVMTVVLIGVSFMSVSAWAEASVYGDFSYNVVDGAVSIVDCADTASGAISIPSEIDGNPVTVIGERAFADCTKITDIIIPASVKTIGSYAFYRCYGLESVTVSFGTESIGEHAFDACTSLSYAFIPTSVQTIGDYAFTMCSALSSVTVSDSVAEIGENSFKHCDAMTDVYVTDGSYAYTYLTSRLVDVELINGDADADGALSNADISLIVRCLSGYDAEDNFNEKKIDVYTDGKLTNRDVIWCIQKLAGWR